MKKITIITGLLLTPIMISVGLIPIFGMIGPKIEWRSNGIAITSSTGNEVSPQIVSDGQGGAIIVWDAGSRSVHSGDILFAQHISQEGKRL